VEPGGRGRVELVPELRRRLGSGRRRRSPPIPVRAPAVHLDRWN